MDSTEKLILNYNDIPAMPNVMVKALGVIRDEASGINDLADVMCYDHALTTQVLKLVNSAYYGFAQQIASVNTALSLIGMNQAKNIIITFAMKPMLTSRGGKSLWQHSIRTAVGCEILAKEFRLMDPAEAFVIGFLHDIGKLVLEIKSPAIYQKAKELALKSGDILSAEDLFFGTNHSDVGFLLAKKWQLPIVVINGIKYHHNPQASSMSNVAYIVYIADRLTQDNISGEIFDAEIMGHCNIDIDSPRLWREQILQRSALLLASLGA